MRNVPAGIRTMPRGIALSAGVGALDLESGLGARATSRHAPMTQHVKTSAMLNACPWRISQLRTAALCHQRVVRRHQVLCSGALSAAVCRPLSTIAGFARDGRPAGSPVRSSSPGPGEPRRSGSLQAMRPRLRDPFCSGARTDPSVPRSHQMLFDGDRPRVRRVYRSSSSG
jgi:hypothetical protein